MAKRNRGLGSSPAAHVHRMRRIIGPLNNALDNAIRWAERGQCTDAAEGYAGAQYHYGELHAHASSTSKTAYSGRSRHLDRVDLTPIVRKVNRARKAVEACIVGILRRR